MGFELIKSMEMVNDLGDQAFEYILYRPPI